MTGPERCFRRGILYQSYRELEVEAGKVLGDYFIVKLNNQLPHGVWEGLNGKINVERLAAVYLTGGKLLEE